MAFIRAALAACLITGAASAYDAFVVTTPGIPGAGGLVPAISATGIATPGSTGNVLTLTDAAPNSIAQIVVGFHELAMPYKGGVLGPQPELFTEQFFTDGLGSYEMDFSLPTDTAIGLEIWIQTFVFDTGALAGLSASNTLRLTAQPTLDINHIYPYATYGMGTLFDLLLEDFNNDGLPDVVAVHQSVISIRLGHKDGTFGDQSAFPFTEYTSRPTLASGDFNGDGHLDVVATQWSNKEFSVLLGNGEGELTLDGSYWAGNQPTGVEVADLDNDGHLDVVFVTVGFDNISLRLGKGDGTFEPLMQLAPGNNPVAVAIDDLDADGILDMVVSYETNNDVSVLMGIGGGAFQVPVGYPAAGKPGHLELVDLDEDGNLDIIVEDSLLGTTNLLGGSGDGTFAFPTVLTSDIRVASSIDFDQDGLLDLVGLSSSNTVAVQLASGVIAYGEPTTIEFPCSTFSSNGLCVGDINDDGLPDIVASRFWGTSFTTIINPGESSFPAHPDVLNTELQVADVAHGDFNGDGRDDLLLVYYPSVLAVKLATGDGTFAAPIQIATTGLSWHAARRRVLVEDFNLDGVLDVLWNPLGQIDAHFGSGDGTFTSAVTTPLAGAPNPIDLAAADLNGDGILDIAMSVDVSGGFGDTAFHYMTLLGAGDGTFTPHVPATFIGNITQLAVRDLDDDGIQDLILIATSRFSILFGRENGTFEDAVMPFEVTPGSGLHDSFALGDFDNDTAVDVMITWVNGLGTKLQFAHGNHDGTFDLQLPKFFGSKLRRTVDLNNDGTLDLSLDKSGFLLGAGDGTFSSFGHACLGLQKNTVSDFNGDCIPDIAIGGEGITLLLSDP